MKWINWLEVALFIILMRIEYDVGRKVIEFCLDKSDDFVIDKCDKEGN